MGSRRNEDSELRPMQTRKLRGNRGDPTIPSSRPTTSRDRDYVGSQEFVPLKKKLADALYDHKTGAVLGRSSKSWLAIISYSIMYVIFLGAFTLVFLYCTLVFLKNTIDYKNQDRLERLTYPERTIGLTAAPTSETNYPLIWYRSGEKDDYEKYVRALDKLLSSNRRKREASSLGPCGQSPYGYGEQPCVILRINKQFNWAGQPLQFNSTVANSAPAEVQNWMRTDKSKLWLQCSGYHSYDKEHIGKIKYYPDPPGFAAEVFPLDNEKTSPLVAIQISEFSLGISLAIECKLWYDGGPSTIDFMLYVAPQDSISYSNSVNV